MIQSQKTHRLVLASIFAAIIFLFTAYLFHIPFATGYIHFGDTLVFLVGTLLPTPYAIGAAVIGTGLSDLLTAPIWVIPTVLIKALVVLMFSSKTPKIICARNIVGLVFAYFINFTGYFVATGFLYQDWLFPIARFYTDVIPPLICAVLFVIIGKIIDRTDLKSKFFV
jgi:uncharacterized repeat protein (TIGR04002 family)